jgi:hypothetical protein
MKKIILLISVLFTATFISAQTNNTLPSNGNVGIGTTNPATKLQVCGNVVMDSSLVVKDTATFERDISLREDLKVDGNVYVNGFVYTSDKIVTPRIVSPINQEIAFGDSTIILNYGLNHIYTNGSTSTVPPLNQSARGLAFLSSTPSPGNIPAVAYATGSMVFGNYLYSDPSAVNSFTFGRGISPQQRFINTKLNSFMVTFNSDIPTPNCKT